MATIVSVTIHSCSNSIFDKQPLDKVSDDTFWRNESDAQMAWTGCYNHGAGWVNNTFWAPRTMLWLDLMAGFGSEKEGRPDGVTDGTMNSSFWVPNQYWSETWKTIVACNNFLDHIDNISMSDDTKKRMKADVRTLRAYHYFYLATFWGDVPLVTTVLSLEEANSVSRTPVSQVWEFIENELTESATYLPETLADSELGKMSKGAAYAILGRALMSQKKWSEAATVYKQIIDSNVYIVEDNFSELFWEKSEYSKEILLSSQYVADNFSHVLPQYLYPEVNGGWHQFSPYNELVKRFECIDGKTIEESPLYDENNPYDNRDPRMLYTVGHYHALCYAPFGFENMGQPFTGTQGYLFGMDVTDPLLKTPQNTAEYGWYGRTLNSLMPLLGERYGTKNLQAVCSERKDQCAMNFGKFTVYAIVEHPMIQQKDGVCLAMKLSEDECMLVVNRCGLQFVSAEADKPNLDLLSVEEGRMENGEWKVTRRLNGDEAALMTFFEPTVLKVKVFTYV